MAIKQPKKVNYLNNRDILKEIHRSKNTYCSYLDRETDHQYDISCSYAWRKENGPYHEFVP